MAACDIYKALSEERKARLRSLSTLQELKEFVEEENIVLTPDQLEAFSGNLVMGGRIKRPDEIGTGLYGKFFVPSEEWEKLVLEARENECAIRQKFPSGEAMEEAVRGLIRGLCPESGSELIKADSNDVFVEACLNMRGPFREGVCRRIAREHARLLEYLEDKPGLPSSQEDILKLWEKAFRSEPRWRDDLPAHFRTAEEGTPFSHRMGSFERTPVPRGSETTPVEQIPEAIDRLIEWIGRKDIPPELHSIVAYLLFVRIHPFADGNGHTSRMLSCGMLASDYSVLTLISWVGILHRSKREVKEATWLTELTRGDLCTPCCMILRMLIRGQRRILAAKNT